MKGAALSKVYLVTFSPGFCPRTGKFIRRQKRIRASTAMQAELHVTKKQRKAKVLSIVPC